MADEWVDYAFSKSKEEEAHWIAATKAYAEVKKYKDLLFRLLRPREEKRVLRLLWGSLRDKLRSNMTYFRLWRRS